MRHTSTKHTTATQTSSEPAHRHQRANGRLHCGQRELQHEPPRTRVLPVDFVFTARFI